MTKILVCNPAYYDVKYSINPWMRPLEVVTHRLLAIEQWYTLVGLLQKLGVTVVEMTGQPELPDMVFTANAGLVFPGNAVVLSSFKYPERRPERQWFQLWFELNGYEIIEAFPEGTYFEGAGDALFREQDDPEHLYFGYGFRSDYKAVTSGWGWSQVWKKTCHYIELVDPYFYHLDTCFCPLKDDFALVYPGAFSADTIDRLSAGLELLKVPEDDAKKFACNAVAIGNKVIIPSGCDATKKLLIGAGFEVFDTDMSEFIKAGGACKCLTLRLE